jgi:hypothetical protein
MTDSNALKFARAYFFGGSKSWKLEYAKKAAVIQNRFVAAVYNYVIVNLEG